LAPGFYSVIVLESGVERLALLLDNKYCFLKIHKKNIHGRKEPHKNECEIKGTQTTDA
jgi:hypothetical protein